MLYTRLHYNAQWRRVLGFLHSLNSQNSVSARYHGEQVTFTPTADPASLGNGVHIHMSFRAKDGKPATYDPDGPCGMAPTTAAFAAGVLRYLDSIVAFTAPSVISHQRLTPHRWSATYNNLGFCDREASLRVCPVMASDPPSSISSCCRAIALCAKWLVLASPFVLAAR